MNSAGDLIVWSTFAAFMMYLLTERMDRPLRHFYPRPSDIRRSEKTRRLVENSETLKWVGLISGWAGLVFLWVSGRTGGGYAFAAWAIFGAGWALFVYSRFALFGPYNRRRAALRRRRQRASEPKADG